MPPDKKPRDAERTATPDELEETRRRAARAKARLAPVRFAPPPANDVRDRGA